MYLSRVIRHSVVSAFAILGGWDVSAHADTFLNFGQMGAPNTLAFETFPTITKSGNQYSLYEDSIVAYFTKTGFTGTSRDQFEIWTGAATGYSKAIPFQNGSDFGITNPNIGAEYYYNLIEAKGTPATDNYIFDVISPYATVTFPTGSGDTAGFRADSNNFTYFATVTNLLQYGHFTSTIAPISVAYSDHSLSSSQTIPGQYSTIRGGFSLTVADVVAGYNFTPEFGLGIHHVLRLNNISASSFAPTRQGFVGPAISYFGLAKSGFFLGTNLNFDYMHSSSLKSSPYLSFYLVKAF